MQNKPVPTEGQNSVKLEAESALRDAACSALWEVQVKGRKCSESWEISVIRKDNLHGHRSWGWFNDTKLLVSHNGGPCSWAIIEFVWDEQIRIAHELCAKLNSGGISLPNAERIHGDAGAGKPRETLPPLGGATCSASETERWFFISDWCKKNSVSPWHANNFNRAALEWAKLNCFEPIDCGDLG